jgi:hypothetical protein
MDEAVLVAVLIDREARTCGDRCKLGVLEENEMEMTQL